MTKGIKVQLSVYTFLGVALMVFVFGYIGINISLQYIQKHYVQLQIDVNKRQAERMAFILQKEIESGLSLDSIKDDFQASILGTEHDKGFLCMYDTKKRQLVSHPNPKTLGMGFTEEFIFTDINTNTSEYIGDVYSLNQPAAGIFKQAGMRTDIIYTIPIKGTDWYVNAHENINAITSELNHLKTRYIFGSLLVGLIIAISASVTARRISRRYENQIEQKNVEITAKSDEIASKNKGITDSINYAQKIQSAVLPNKKILDDFTGENFIFHKPKDIVSGDFYWFSKIEDKVVIVAADCTGHGVPGAFMSMLGISLLNELVNRNHICNANHILNELRNELKKSLGQEGDNYESQDGIDMALCVIDSNKQTIQYAGAYNPLYLIRKEGSSYNLIEYKADRMPIGIHPKDNNEFVNQVIPICKNDRIYIFSDGYISQFGGDNNSKYKSKRLKELLLSIQNEKFDKQRELIDTAYQDWKGSNEQVDDILLMGFEV